jgi:hypothetical protein
MQLPQPIDNPGIRLRDPLRLTHIVEPGWRVVAFRPHLRLGQVAQQVPMASAIPSADPPALCHEAEELRDIVLTIWYSIVITIGPLRG